MRDALRKTWKILLVLAFLAGAAVPFASPPADAAPGCGSCSDGTTDPQTYACSGPAANCSECTVCAK